MRGIGGGIVSSIFDRRAVLDDSTRVGSGGGNSGDRVVCVTHDGRGGTMVEEVRRAESTYLNRAALSTTERALEIAREALAKIGRASTDEYAREVADQALTTIGVLTPRKLGT